MVKIQDYKTLLTYIEKYKLHELFSQNMEEYMELYRFNKNEFICREDEKINSMFFLVEGKAKVSKHLENGKSLLLSFYTPLTIIGDVEFVKNNYTDCSVQAITDTYCIVINIDITRSLLKNDCKFLYKMCDYLSEKLTNSSNNTSINLLYPLESRLASYIVAFADKKDNVNKIIFKENYGEIAELLGTSYRHLNRTLNKFCDEEILMKNKKEYYIKNLEKLSYLAGELYK